MRTVFEFGDLTYQCKECEGTGQAVPGCEACDGNGWVDDPEDGGTKTCPECESDKCDSCKGTGEIPEGQA